jgi:hypothetical protein
MRASWFASRKLSDWWVASFTPLIGLVIDTLHRAALESIENSCTLFDMLSVLFSLFGETM